jgi:hypothetical protein
MATDQSTKQTVDKALKYSPSVQTLHSDKNVTVTITNGPTNNLPGGKDGAATGFVKVDGKLNIMIKIDPSVAGDKTSELTRTELGRAEQIYQDPEGMEKAAAQDPHAKVDDAQKKGEQIKKDIEKGEAAEEKKKKEKTP